MKHTNISHSTVWGCVVHRPDLKYLRLHLDAVCRMAYQPHTILIVDNDGASEIRKVVESASGQTEVALEYVDGSPNRGFNPGFEHLLEKALRTEGAEYLAAMTVRARPRRGWLAATEMAIKMSARCGAVATLQLSLSHPGLLHGVGHYYRRNGGLYDFGRDLPLDVVQRWFQDNPGRWVWSPCSGSALYRMEALRESKPASSWLDPWAFKSYNCNLLGWFMLNKGWQVSVAWGAISDKNTSESSSTSPNSPGLLVNQELCRIEQLFAFWPEPERADALTRYESEGPRKHFRNSAKCFNLSKVDRRLIVTRAAARCLSVPCLHRAQDVLREHLDFSERYHQWASAQRKALRASPKEVPRTASNL